ncbi:MAG: transposase [Alphaproteobacteria bacterium]|nr:transposase [Alphaproteobacteria bacterium]MDE2112004.1 transposase [Alphaproteobacteria bacterium]MDE2492338.1 transposase [Alphaproteobacteria bacterium]
MTVPISGQMTKVYEMDTRRRWSDAEKHTIIEESKTSPVARVVKKHGVAVSLLFRWRKMQGIRVRRPADAPPSAFIQLALPVPARTGCVGSMSGGRRGRAITAR